MAPCLVSLPSALRGLCLSPCPVVSRRLHFSSFLSLSRLPRCLCPASFFVIFSPTAPVPRGFSHFRAPFLILCVPSRLPLFCFRFRGSSRRRTRSLHLYVFFPCPFLRSVRLYSGAVFAPRPFASFPSCFFDCLSFFYLRRDISVFLLVSLFSLNSTFSASSDSLLRFSPQLFVAVLFSVFLCHSGSQCWPVPCSFCGPHLLWGSGGRSRLISFVGAIGLLSGPSVLPAVNQPFCTFASGPWSHCFCLWLHRIADWFWRNERSMAYVRRGYAMAAPSATVYLAVDPRLPRPPLVKILFRRILGSRPTGGLALALVRFRFSTRGIALFPLFYFFFIFLSSVLSFYLHIPHLRLG